MNSKHYMLRPRRTAGFTLIELLVVIAIIAILASIAIPALASARVRSAGVACAGNLRQLGAAIHLYCADNDGAFPRSFHSAGAHREPGWVASIGPYLGTPEDSSTGGAGKIFRCPADANPDREAASYGLNVCFELTPDGDDYLGAPASWRKVVGVTAPNRTILLAEVRSAAGGMAADHFMCHQWSSVAAAKNAVAHDRHDGRSNYLFVDGHVESLTVEQTFLSRGENMWNPSAASNL